MWEKAAFVAYFIGLCMAQREAMADLRARQSIPPRLLVDSPLPPSATSDTLVPREPQFTPDVPNAGPNVFTTVLFPSVPTAAPTGVVVPIFVTFTDTLIPSEVPSGFQWTPPASIPGTFAPTAIRPTSPVMPTLIPTSFFMPIPSTFMTRPSLTTPSSSRITTSTTSSRTSSTTTSSTSSKSILTSSISTSSTSTTSSSSSSAASVSNTNLANNGASPKNTHALNSRSIAGLVVGLISAAILVGALILFLWSRRRRDKRPESPGVYPQEAYLYDPPMTPPRGPSPGPNGGDIGRALSPERPGAEREALMGAAGLATGGVGAVAAVERGRAGSEARPPQESNGYSPVLSRDATDQFGPVAGPSRSVDPFSDPRYELGAGTAAASTQWPMNPKADSGLGTPPGSAAGRSSTGRLSTGRPSTSRSRGTGTPPGPGPSISGVGSSRYERTLSTSEPRSPGGGIYMGPSPQMRELRRAWGIDQ